jgi:hypothetical protein
VAPAGFVTRTGDLLFAGFQDDDAYLIGIKEHGSWTDISLVTIAVRNWPGANLLAASKRAIGVRNPTNDEDRSLTRNGGITGVVEIDGRVYMPPGQTMAGTPIAGTQKAFALIRNLRNLQQMLNERPQEPVKQLRAQGTELASDPQWIPYEEGGWYGISDRLSGGTIPYLDLTD